ncbi:MAG: glycerol-3-phosphate 1-O-acyltransferase PlsY [Clostridia bacterium]
MQYLAIMIIAYVIGSLNFAIVISKLVLKKDIRDYGSKNAGTTNAFRIMGAKLGALVLVGDISKAFIAVLIGSNMGGDKGKLLAGILVIIGHVYPVYFKFKGGKGVATATGMLLAFDLKMFAILFVIFMTVLLVTKFVSLSSLSAGAFLPFGMYIYYGDAIFVLTGTLIFLGVVYLHRANIVRLINHEENKISFKKN